MKIKNFNIVIVLVAEILVMVYGYVYKYQLSKLVTTMGLVFVIFFTIGSILQALSNRLFAQVEAKAQAEKEDLDQEAPAAGKGQIQDPVGDEQADS